MDFQEFYNTLSAEQRGLVDGHIAGLKNALTSERDARQTAQDDLKKLQAKHGTVETQLQQLTAQTKADKRKAAFYEAAGAAGLDAKKVKAAFKLALTDEMFGDDDKPDFEKLKAEYPDFFAGEAQPQRKPKSNAAENGNATGGVTFDDMIRARAGAGGQD